MNYVLVVLAVAFLGTAGFAKYEQAQLHAARAELTTATTQRNDFRDAANVNAASTQKVKDALDKCNGLLTVSTSDAKTALDEQAQRARTLAQRLAAAKAETDKLLGGQCKAWADAPACPSALE